MELNKEQIINALEYYSSSNVEVCRNCSYQNINWAHSDILKQALNFIKKQEEQIFKFEHQLEEQENGYEGTLHLERCKLHDAEEKVKELTQALEEKQNIYNELRFKVDDIFCDVLYNVSLAKNLLIVFMENYLDDKEAQRNLVFDSSERFELVDSLIRSSFNFVCDALSKVNELEV